MAARLQNALEQVVVEREDVWRGYSAEGCFVDPCPAVEGCLRAGIGLASVLVIFS